MHVHSEELALEGGVSTSLGTSKLRQTNFKFIILYKILFPNLVA